MPARTIDSQAGLSKRDNRNLLWPSALRLLPPCATGSLNIGGALPMNAHVALRLFELERFPRDDQWAILADVQEQADGHET